MLRAATIRALSAARRRRGTLLFFTMPYHLHRMRGARQAAALAVLPLICLHTFAPSIHMRLRWRRRRRLSAGNLLRSCRSHAVLFGIFDPVRGNASLGGI